MRSKYERYAILIILVFSALVISGCEQKTINEIKAEPGRYADRDVAVVGTVTESYSVLGSGWYEIEDGTGKLLVVSKSGVPRKGARIAVKGKIRDAVNLGSLVPLPKQISSGLVMIEDKHKAR